MPRLKSARRPLWQTSLALFLLLSFALAQSEPVPRLLYVFPMGGQAGASIEIKFTGQEVEEAEGLHFSIPGVKVEVVKPEPKKTDKDDKAKQDAKKKGPLTEQTFRVTLPKDAAPGIHDVRVITKGGVSNPRAFVVGDQRETVEKEPNNDVDQAQKIELNTVVHGVISAPTDVDYYTFTGKQGQRVLCSGLTTSIDSKLPIALEMYDSAGALLGMNRNYQNNDALLDVTLPADSEYFVRVFSFTYTQGGADHFYRLSIGTTPWIDAVFPPTIEPGKAATVTVFGRNLPGGKPDPASVVEGKLLETLQATVKAPAEPGLDFAGLIQPSSAVLDGFEYRLRNDHGLSNPFLLTLARAPVVLDNGKNQTPATAQTVPVPSEIAGRVEKKGDDDWYAFTAKKGQTLLIETFGERLGAPLDLYFVLQDDKGKRLTEQDDVTDILSPQFYTRSDDPGPFRFRVPNDGTYHLKVASRGALLDAGPRHLYTVRIIPDEPDFQVIIMPTSLLTPDAGQLGQGGRYAYTVYVWRQGAFNGDVTLTGDKLPPGLSIPPQVISGQQTQAPLVIHAEPNAKPWVGPIRVIGTANIDGRKLVRTARGATLTWPIPQPNIPAATRLDREVVLAVRDQAPYTLQAGVEKLSVMQGDKISVPLKLQLRSDFKSNVQVTAPGLPKELNMQPLTLEPGKKEGTAVIAGKGNQPIPPGNYNLVLVGQTQPPTGKPPPKGPTPPNFIQATQPIALSIIPKQLGKLTVAPTTPKVQPGQQVELTVKLDRQYDLPIPLKVEVVLPKNVKGLTAKEATIKPKEQEVKVIIAAAKETPVGNAPLVIQATALFNDKVPVVHETKLNLNVAK